MSARRVRRTTSIALFALVGAIVFPLLAMQSASGADWHEGACVGDSGVTVVVDATMAGAGTSVRCALGPQANGWEALQHAHHTVAPHPTFAGAVCQIDGIPTEGYPTCWETNFWSYHHAPNARPGASWTFSVVGANTYKPGPGSVEGWKYTSTATQRQPPGVGPVFAEATPPTPPPTAPPTSVPPPPSAAVPTKPGTGPSGATVPPTGTVASGSSPTTTTVGAAPLDAATTTVPAAVLAAPGATTTSTSAASSADDALPAGRALGGVDLSSKTHASSGFPLAMLAGIALIVAFAASAGVVAYRRRTAP
jgi:hypothetical protein